MNAIERAFSGIDAVHGEDPARTPDGRAKELVYAERMSHWLGALVPDASDALRIARAKKPRSSTSPAVPRGSSPTLCDRLREAQPSCLLAWSQFTRFHHASTYFARALR